MTYRDDADAMFERATALQREVDEMREQLAERDRKLAELGTSAPRRRSVPPPIPRLPEYPDAAAMIDRLLESTERPDERMPSGKYPTFPTGESANVELEPEPPAPAVERDALIAQIRRLSESLTYDDLMMIGSIVEALAAPRIDPGFVSKLRALAQRAAWSR